MIIQFINEDQIKITLSSSIDDFSIQRLFEYAKFLESTRKNKTNQSDIDKLAAEVNISWWKKNHKRFIDRP
jgi:hypothetical protein